jgi:hypothetical protein
MNMSDRHIKEFFDRLSLAKDFNLKGGNFPDIAVQIISLYKKILFSDNEMESNLLDDFYCKLYNRLCSLACKCGFEIDKKLNDVGAKMFLLKVFGNADFILLGETSILDKKVCLIVGLTNNLYYDLSYLPLHDFSFVRNEKLNRNEFLVFRRKLGLPKKKYTLSFNDFKGLFFIEKSSEKKFIERVVTNKLCVQYNRNIRDKYKIVC